MIVPVKCFGCGKVLGDVYRAYLEEVRKIKTDRNMDPDRIIYLTHDNHIEITPEKQVMDLFRINKMCCRNQLLTTVEL
jgi:DNA-directed RNA polymerase subunit N (RpoN/RPB10)